MMIEEDIRTYLLSVDAVTALVNQQIYGVERPQGKRPLPEILIQQITSTRQQLFCGQDGLVSADIQIDCYGLGASQAGALARATRQALRDFHGTMGETRVDKVFIANEFQANDPEPGTIRKVQTFTFWYQED